MATKAAMTTETMPDPLEQAVMEAAEPLEHLNNWPFNAWSEERRVVCERLRLHVQLALAKARREQVRRDFDCSDCSENLEKWSLDTEIAALEARLKEMT